KAHGKSDLEALRKRAKMSPEEFSVALGWMRKKGWTTVERGPEGSIAAVTERGDAALESKSRDEEVIARLAKAELTEDEIDPAVLKDLRSRKDIVAERETVRRRMLLTDAGRKVLTQGIELKEEGAQLTPEHLRSGKRESVEIRPYDVRAFAPTIHAGKGHIRTEA